MTEYAYGPGEWTALAHGGRAALLDPSIGAAAVTAIWESLSGGGSLEAWLEVLAGNGLASLPSFGFVEPGEDGVRVVVRGDVAALVDDYDVSAGGMRTWREHVAPAGSGVVLQVGSAEVSYPLVAGIVLAASLQIGEIDREQGTEGADAGAADGGAAAAAIVADTSGEPGDDQGSADAVEETEESSVEEVADADHAVVAAEQAEPEPDQGVDEQADEQAEGEQPEEDVEPDFVLDEDEAGEPDEAGGVAESDPEGDWAEEAGAVQMQGLPDGATAAGEQPLAPPLPAEPWAAQPIEPQASQWGPPSAQPAGGLEEPQDVGDHDGYTIRAADLPQPAHEEPVDMTLAPHDDDHAGPEQAATVLLSLSTGQQLELDRPVLIGRAPESSRFGFGETPRLVTVPSPQQDISRTHVEVKLEGDNVLVTDLRSTNGTVVVLPGSPPRRLHPGESVPVPVGTVVDLGDGITAVVTAPTTTPPIVS